MNSEAKNLIICELGDTTVEICKILNRLDFSTSGSFFNDKNEGEIKSVLVDYYENNKTLKQIAKESNKKINPAQLRKEFPKILSKNLCKHDLEKMYIELPIKQDMNNFSIKEETSKCLKCAHTSQKNCKCDNCLEEAKEKLVETYSTEEKVDITICSLSDRIILATLLQGLHANQIDSPFGSYRDFEDKGSPMFFNDTDAFKKIEILSDKGILSVSPASDLNAFVVGDNFPSTYYPLLVKWCLQVESNNVDNDRTLLDFLKYPNSSIVRQENDLDKIWKEIAVNELIRLFDFQLKEFKFAYKHNTDGDKVSNAITRWLELYSPSQVYSLFWMAVRQSDNARTTQKWGKFEYHHIDFILKKIDDIIRYKLNKGQKIDSYGYPNKVSTTLFTKVFFDQIALIPDWFSKNIPKENQHIPKKSFNQIEFYESLLNREEQIMDCLISGINYYYITNYGIIVNDGLVDWLFADEKTLYNISKVVGESETSGENKEFYFNLDLPYYINDIYSTSYLMKLIRMLESSDCVKHIPERNIAYINYIEKELGIS